jgi:UDP-N-acetylmuramoyl-tripeptide--D-alanyl-D-alanine ligase
LVDLELDERYQFFICEMAAYHNDDIRELCYMVPPDYGIITGINRQHLERFGSLKNIIKTKFELYDSTKLKRDFVFNLNDPNIKSEVVKRQLGRPKGYLEAKDISFSPQGSRFTIVHQGRNYPISTYLFGYSNVENICGAIAVALVLGQKIRPLVKKASQLEPFSSRLAIKNLNSCVVVDNTYSSNENSFIKTVETAKKITGKKALVTPGLVELGDQENAIHQRLGLLAKGVFDKIILVGRTPRTIAFARASNEKTEFIADTKEDYMKALNKLSKKFDWIFLENDVTQNY